VRCAAIANIFLAITFGQIGCATKNRVIEIPTCASEKLFFWRPRSVERGWRRGHVVSRRPFWQITDCATSLAYVLRLVYRHNFLFHGSAAGISRVAARIIRSWSAGFSAVATAEFLARPNSLNRRVAKRVNCTSLGSIAARAVKTRRAPSVQRYLNASFSNRLGLLNLNRHRLHDPLQSAFSRMVCRPPLPWDYFRLARDSFSVRER
jgi:hypothetical protein